jgi:hypothetical protein
MSTLRGDPTRRLRGRGDTSLAGPVGLLRFVQ